MFQYPNLFQRLHHLPIDAARRVDVVARPAAPVLRGPVDFPQPADADGFAQVYVPRDGGRAGVEPVDGLGGKLFSVGCPVVFCG